MIRRAADVAQQAQVRRHALHELVGRFQNGDGLARLSAYLTLKYQGDEQAIWSLYQTVSPHSLSLTFIRQLGSDIQGRLRDERRKRAEEEEKLLLAPGTIHFD